MVKNKKLKINQLSKNKVLIIAVAFLAILAIALIFFNSNRNNSESLPSLPEPIENINLDPPTEEEEKQASDNKQRIDEKESQVQNPIIDSSSGKKVVTPLITYSGQFGDKIEIGSYVQEVFEDNGVCTAELTFNGALVIRQVNSVKEGRSTFCPMFEIPMSEFIDKGVWALVVKYESPVSKGQSQETKIEIR